MKSKLALFLTVYLETIYKYNVSTPEFGKVLEKFLEKFFFLSWKLFQLERLGRHPLDQGKIFMDRKVCKNVS